MPLNLIPEIYVTTEPLDLISHEKMYAKIPEGTIWMPLNENNEPKATMLYGQMTYAADMIFETEEGARGKTFKETVDGYKVYMGGIALLDKSKRANTYDLNLHNISGTEFFLSETKTHLENYNKFDVYGVDINDRGNFEVNDVDLKTHKPGDGFVIWSREEKKKNVLFSRNDGSGIIHGKEVHVLKSDGFVSISNGTITIQNNNGREIVIDKSGIKSPRELRDLGKNISKIVKDSMKKIDYRVY